MLNMPKDQMQMIAHKLHHKRNTLLKAFVINIALVVVFWLVSMSGFYFGMMEHLMMSCDAQTVAKYTYDFIGLWKVLGVVLFLVPALAAHWELKCVEKHLGK
ncbi:MAG: hypothetical protein LBL46_04740 [Rickettsiales bacterium]|nr:hypothetical protein [Rickettsiales bacterium]